MYRWPAVILALSALACVEKAAAPDANWWEPPVTFHDAEMPVDASEALDAEEVGEPDADPMDAMVARDAPARDAIVAPDAPARDAIVAPDAPAPDAIVAPDAPAPDAIVAPDAPAPDATLDAGIGMDAIVPDTGVPPDAGRPDSGVFPDAAPRDSGVPIGAPLPLPAPRTWGFIPFSDAYCDDGSTTGIGVNTSTRSSNVLLFFNGGGACWNHHMCAVANASAHGPFTAGEFNTLGTFLNSGVFDRTQPLNQFRDWNFVFIPYCTGDVHAGTNTVTYTSTAGPPRTIRHVGHNNVIAYMRRLAGTFTAPGQVAVVGVSAGGYGALYNYPDIKDYWPNVTMGMIDDSGSPLPGPSIPQSIINSWMTNWRLDRITDRMCGAICRTDISAFPLAVAAAFPQDRLAHLGYLGDPVMSSYLGNTPQQYQAAMNNLGQLLDGTPNFKYFYSNAGPYHVLLNGNPWVQFANGYNLMTWVGWQLSGDPRWVATRP